MSSSIEDQNSQFLGDGYILPSFASTTDLLHYLYADLTRLALVASADITLHRFDNPGEPLRGVAAAQSHEESLVAATGGTLAMDVESIRANSHFGAVLGILRARGVRGEELAVPFCGLWKFVDGRPVEHWENVAADPGDIVQWLATSRGNGQEK